MSWHVVRVHTEPEWPPGFLLVLCIATKCFPAFLDADSCLLHLIVYLSPQVWKREAHEKKANTVHTHPSNRHLFVTVSGARG